MWQDELEAELSKYQYYDYFVLRGTGKQESFIKKSSFELNDDDDDDEEQTSMMSSPYLVSWVQKQFETELVCKGLSKNPHESSIDFIFHMQRKKEYAWLPEQIVEWRSLSCNPSYNAFSLLEAFPEKIDNREFSRNHNVMAVRRLSLNPSMIDYEYLVQNTNPQVLPIIYENKENIMTKWLSKCPHNCVVAILAEYPDQIVAKDICMNSCDAAVDLVLNCNLAEHNRDWVGLSSNSHDAIVDLLFRNQSKIDWAAFSLNRNPRVLHFLSRNQKKINWPNLSRNSHQESFEILRQNPTKIDAAGLAENSAIFF